MMQLVILFLEFFKIGLFSVGGGLATLPFLYDLANKYEWLRLEQIPNMVAVSESTPGPLGVNMATYAGFQCAGVLGSVVATLGLVTPSVIIIIFVYCFLEKFRSSPMVERAFYGLRPVVVGLIGAAGFGVVAMALLHMQVVQTEGVHNIVGWFRWKECILFLLIFLRRKSGKKYTLLLSLWWGLLLGYCFKWVNGCIFLYIPFSNMAQQILKEVDGSFKAFFGLRKLAKQGKYSFKDCKLPRYLPKDGYTTLVIGFVRRMEIS